MGNILAISKRMALPTAGSSKPVMFILGATGTGKSDLAIKLAKHFNGEVINADAMQLYRGLDVVTNKVTPEEQDGVPHHMLGILGPDSLSYTIHNFKKEAKQTISKILTQGKLPIVVGGTNYYVDSLMWDSLIPKHESGEDSSRFSPSSLTLSDATLTFLNNEDVESTLELSSLSIAELNDITKNLDTNYMRLHVDKVNSSRLHQLLMLVDKETAVTMHPNATRKVIRALEVLKQHGVSQSDFVASMNKKAGDQTFGANLSYANSIVLWLQCEQEILDSRLDKRVDKMMDQGLISELDWFNISHNRRISSSDSPEEGHGGFTRGVFQCIGFKEFYSYLVLSEAERQSKQGEKMLAQGIGSLKSATRRYARYQHRWVRKQLFELRNPTCVPPVYVFDSSDRDLYTRNVVEPAITLTGEILRGVPPTQARYVLETKSKEDNDVVFKTCEPCGVTCVRRCEWDSHMLSRRHRKRLAAIRTTKLNMERAHKSLSDTLCLHEVNLSSQSEDDSVTESWSAS